MRTFAFAHLKELEDIEERSNEKPIGALILTMQAVSFRDRLSFSQKL